MASIFDVANCLLWIDHENNGEGLTNLKLQKLCYYAQGFHLAVFNRPLFQENIDAWVHGPVSPDLYHELKKFGSELIPLQENIYHNINSEEFELISEVYKVFGQYSAWRLRDMTHEEPTWMTHEGSASTIPLHEMSDYFKTRLN